jgi:hypothetical protein
MTGKGAPWWRPDTRLSSPGTFGAGPVPAPMPFVSLLQRRRLPVTCKEGLPDLPDPDTICTIPVRPGAHPTGKDIPMEQTFTRSTALRLPVCLFRCALLLALAAPIAPSLAQAANTAPAKEQPKPAKEPPKPAKELPKPAAVPLRSNFIVAELDCLSGSAEEIFSLALAGKMERTAKKLETLKKNAAAFDYIQDEASNILLPRLGRTIADLEKAIAAKNRLDTMRFANRVTLIAATVAVPLKPSVPTEVSLLDYNGRELEIWSEVKMTEKLSSIVIRMHLAWQTLMPKLIEQNGLKELRRFSDLMGHLESARLPEEYGRLSRQVLVETDTMKSIFVRPAK